MTESSQYNLKWLLDVLCERSLLSQAQRREIEVSAPAQRVRVGKRATLDQDPELASRYEVSPAELIASYELKLADGSLLDEDRLAQLIALAAGLPYHKIDPLKLDMHLITGTLSRPFAARHVVLPLCRQDGELQVAVADPFDRELQESLQRISHSVVRRVISSKSDILKSVVEVYGFRKSVESAAKERSTRDDQLADFEQLVRLRSVGELDSTDQHVVNAVDFLLRYAFDQRASDIHIEPKKSDTQVRLRIDGMLHNTHTLPRPVHPAFTARIKAIARLDIAEKRRPQDGRIKTELGEREIELRVSTLPTAFGEKTVIRIFDPDVLLRGLPDLGLDPRDQAVFNGWISRPSGIVLITGPTGSGKTTTLYTTLKALAHEGVNVTTVEDPIEMITDCFNQVAAQPKIGIDFANAMRAILRQDPDIIMVGEIRDSATAEMAAQAALTGHLVFSTLHTNDTPSAVTRLVDLGVPRFLIASTVVGVMAQRLVRLICSRCHTPTPLSDEQLRALGVTDPSMFAHTAQGRGCVECRGTGYRGRIGVFELLSFDHTLADAVTSGATENALRDLAKGRGLRSFGENALDRLAAGITTFEEVMRVRGPGATLLNEEPPPTPPESVDLTELAILTDDSKDDPR